MKINRIIGITLLLFIAVFFRFWLLGDIPVGVTNDEAGGFFNTYSIAVTGRSIDGRFLPLSMNLDNSSAPVFVYLTVPFIWLFGISAYAIRIPFAILSLGSVFLLYLITQRLIQNRYVALSAAFALAVSPWNIHMNRGAYDGPITFFFLLAIYVFLRKVENGNILWTLPWILISFYSYHATKIFWIAFIPMLLLIFRRELSARKREVMLFLIGCLAIGASFWFVLRFQGVTRQQVLLTPDMTKLSRQVDWERTANTAPWVLRVVYSNKLFVYGREILMRYVQAFSPQLLFVTGEIGIYGTYYHGLLYLLDVPLLLLGFLYLARLKQIHARNLIIGSIFLAPLPSSITSDVSFAMRGIYMLPFLMMLIGCGFYQLVLWAQRFKGYTSLSVIYMFFGLYAFSIVGYFYLYFYRYSIYGAELWFASSKDVSEAIGVMRRKYDRVWVSRAGAMYLFQYGLYNRSDLSSVARAWNGPWPKQIDNVYLFEDCITPKGKTFDPKSDLPVSTLYITRQSCHSESTPSATIQDRGEPLLTLWKFYDHKEY